MSAGVADSRMHDVVVALAVVTGAEAGAEELFGATAEKRVGCWPIRYTPPSMEMRLVFDPRLDIDGESFAAHWRERPNYLALGSFTVERSGPQTFGEPGTLLTFVGGIATGVLTNALWDGIKWTYGRLCATKGEPVREVEFQHVRQADGTEVTIVRIKE